jgi:hypothetical protein
MKHFRPHPSHIIDDVAHPLILLGISWCKYCRRQDTSLEIMGQCTHSKSFMIVLSQKVRDAN